MRLNRFRLIIICTVLLMSWALVMRLAYVGTSSYWLDEGYSVTLGQAIAQHGYPLLDSGEMIWRSPLYHYVLGVWLALLGTSEMATRVLSIGLGMVSIMVCSYAAHQWFGRRVGYITLVLTSFATWEIVWSRQARMYMALQVLLWLAVIVWQRWLQHRRPEQDKRGLWLVVLAVGAAMLTHEFAALLIIILPAYWLMQRAQKPTQLIWVMLGLFMLLPLIITAFHYGLQQPVPVNYWSHYAAFLWRDHAVILVLAVVSLVVVQRRHLTTVFWLSSVGLFTLGLFGFGIPLLHYRYLFFVYPIMLWLAAYTINWMWSWRRRWLSCCVTGVVLCALIWHHELSLLPQTFWPLESDPQTSQFAYKSFSPQPNFRDAYAAIATQLQQHDAPVITPYPELSRLYLKQDDTYALYLDVVGSTDQPPRPNQIYTGVQYITLTQLKQASTDHALVLLDYFSERRIQSDIRQYIQTHGDIIYRQQTGDWSEITVYQF